MSIGVYTANFALASGGSLALVLDASESAESAQGAISTLVLGVLASLPARVACSLYFLGNPAPYPAGDFALKASRWFGENRGRGSILAPVAEVLAGQSETPVVLIGAGQVYDLEDWAGTPLLGRTTLVAMGASLQGAQALALEIDNPSPNDLFQRVHDPVTTVRIGGDGFMPLGWGNSGYSLTKLAGSFLLTGERLDDFSTSLRFLCAGGAMQAAATLASGHTRELAIAGQPAPAESAGWDGTLTPAEVTVFQAALARTTFTCPHCRGQHGWDVLKCEEGPSLLGTPIYTSPGAKPGQIVLFRAEENAVRFRVVASGVLALGDGQVVLSEGSRGTIYAYQAATTRWEAGAPPQLYQPVGGGSYAVLL
jgi:hypothetical protein